MTPPRRLVRERDPEPFIIGVDLSSKKIAIVGRSPSTQQMVIHAANLGRTKSSNFSFDNSAVALDVMHDFLNAVGRIAGFANRQRIAYIEAPNIPHGRGNVMGSLKQAYIHGVVQACLIKAGFTIESVVVSSWKKVVCGNGSATKQQVSRCVQSLWPSAFAAADGDQDIIDATAIQLFGRRHAAKARAGR